MTRPALELELPLAIERMAAAQQRSLRRMAEIRRAGQLDIQAKVEGRKQVLEAALPEPAELERHRALHRSFGSGRAVVEDPEGQLPSTLEGAIALWRKTSAALDDEQRRLRAEQAAQAATRRKRFSKPPPPPTLGPTFGQGLALLELLAGRLPAMLSAELDVVRRRAQEEAASNERSALALADGDTTDEHGRLTATHRDVLARLGPGASPWAEVRAVGECPVATHLRVGAFVPSLPGTWPAFPAVVPFRSGRGLAIDSHGPHRDRALRLTRSLVLRALHASPAGQLHLTLFDPVALGQSVSDFLHLGDHDERLVDTKPWTTAAEIERKLLELSLHIETVISKYLRGQFATIDEYNVHAGAVAEPDRLLVYFDGPAELSERAAALLLSVVENGPRCGVHTLIAHDPSIAPSRDVSTERLLANMDRIEWTGEHARLVMSGAVIGIPIEPDACPPIEFDIAGRPRSVGAEILGSIGSAVREADAVTVDLSQSVHILNRMVAAGLSDRIPTYAAGPVALSLEDPGSWWRASTMRNVVAPIGRSGAQRLASLVFSSTAVAGGALVVGLPRSGKTTALHSAIVSMCTLYPPEELELYLIDAKHGVEFRAYADLPHARLVAINNDREFAVAVLRSLDEEIQRRAELMKVETPGRTNLEEYRIASGKALPRIVVVLDEFHEIFEEDDRLGQAAFAAFSNIVRQGPFAGIHPVLASQTLSSMPAMDRNTLALLPTRLTFMCNETDAEFVMGHDNQDVRFLSRPGEGLLNAVRGEPSHNERFQGIYLSPDERDKLLRRVRTKAAECGWLRRPRVFDGDEVLDRDAVAPSSFFERSDRPKRIRFLVGEPIGIAESVDVHIRRHDGGNVVFVGDADDEGVPGPALLGAFHSLLLGLCSQAGQVDVVDCIGDEGTIQRPALDALCRELGFRHHRRRALGTVLADCAGLVRERSLTNDHAAPARVLIIFGLQRATGLEPEVFDSSAGEPSAADAMRELLLDGPDHGVHVVCVSDTAAAVSRRLGRDAMAQFSIRIGAAIQQESELQGLLDSYGPLRLRRNQIVIHDANRNRTIKAMPYGPVTTGWLGSIAVHETRNGHGNGAMTDA